MEKGNQREIDLLIVGGGATGAGCLLEGARRGLTATLVEKGDFASGTTSASSRLIHGGIRYLEHLHLGLVMESIRERNWISRHFPHMLRPLAIHIPVYGWGKRSALAARIGVSLYDFLAGEMSLEKSRVFTAGESRELFPELAWEGLSGMFVFHDYQIVMPERLVLENIMAAERLGASARNYCGVTKIVDENGKLRVVVRDERDGNSSSYLASSVINAAGPWGDMVRGMAGHKNRVLRPTKGVHIEVPGFTGNAFFAEAGSDGRLFFTLPFMGHNIIGTTDTYHRGTPDDAGPNEEDISYLLINSKRLFRHQGLSREAVYSAYSGCRPLINVPGKKASAVPRKHRIISEGRGGRMISVTGGKLTTYRKMAEEAVEKVVSLLGRGREPVYEYKFPSKWAGQDGEGQFLDHLKGEYGIGDRTARSLFTLFGAGAERILGFAGSDRGLLAPISEETREVPIQIIHSFERESANCLEDVLLRRMLIGKTPFKGYDLETDIMKVLIKYIGLSPGEAKEMVHVTWRAYGKKFLMKGNS